MMSGDSWPPPPGWELAEFEDDDLTINDLTEDAEIRAQRKDGTGEPVEIAEAWRIYSRETGEPNLMV